MRHPSSPVRRVLAATALALPAIGFLVVLGPDSGAQAAEVTETYDTVGPAEFVVPDGVACVTFTVTGAGGGDGGDFESTIDVSPPAEGQDPPTVISPGGSGGLGGQVTATVIVTPGETLQINVGGAGESGEFGGSGGVNGGAQGGDAKGSEGGGGGGASDVRQGGTTLDDRILVGGGGGGGGAGGPAEAIADSPPAPEVEAVDAYESADAEGFPTDNPGGDGGDGGTPAGTDGTDGYFVGVSGGEFGTGGTQTAGGDGGATSTNVPGDDGLDGSFGAGGAGGESGDGGGGGGGGWYGGGGGGAGYEGTGAGAGGGSGYGPAGSTFVNGVEAGDGSVVVSYTPGDVSCGGVLDDDVEDDVIEATPPFTG